MPMTVEQIEAEVLKLPEQRQVNCWSAYANSADTAA